MNQETLLISEAAKQVQVETHVLRYWEEELQLPIKRNEMGHRYYTMEDVNQFREIKLLKEQGLQLKAIRSILRKDCLNGVNGNSSISDSEMAINANESTDMDEASNRNLDVNAQYTDKCIDMDAMAASAEEKAMDYMIGKRQKFIVSLSDDKSREEKAKRLQYLLQHMITESVKSANKELCAEIKESVLKELDYQFRARDEREEEHWKKEEEHYRKVDEMLRQHYKIKEKPPKKERKKRNKKNWMGSQV